MERWQDPKTRLSFVRSWAWRGWRSLPILSWRPAMEFIRPADFSGATAPMSFRTVLSQTVERLERHAPSNWKPHDSPIWCHPVLSWTASNSHQDFRISTSVLGYTVAAAGTSFPNVFSGMCVARHTTWLRRALDCASRIIFELMHPVKKYNLVLFRKLRGFRYLSPEESWKPCSAMQSFEIQLV